MRTDGVEYCSYGLFNITADKMRVFGGQRRALDGMIPVHAALARNTRFAAGNTERVDCQSECLQHGGVMRPFVADCARMPLTAVQCMRALLFGVYASPNVDVALT